LAIKFFAQSADPTNMECFVPKNKSSFKACGRQISRGAALAIILPLLGCSTESVLNDKSILKIRMFGSLEAPTGAEGTASPVSQTYVLSGVTLTKSDGSGDVELFEGDPLTLRVVTRPQLIYTYEDLGDYVTDKVTFSKITVKFDPQVLVATKETDEISLDLESGDLSLTEDFTPEDSTEHTLNLKVAWGKTVTTQEDGSETVASPAITLTYKDLSE